MLRHTAWSAALTAVAVGLTACGSSSDSGSKSTTTTATPSAATAPATDAKIAALVPAATKAKGTLTFAADATYPPNEFIAGDGKTVVGMDADLAKALASVMGLKAKVLNVTFNSIIPRLVAKRYDIGLSSFTDTKEREKVVDFVTYFTAGTSFFTKTSGSVKPATLADLCGTTVAVESGTTQADDAAKQGKACKAAGKPDVKVLVFPDQSAANLALQSGRAQIGMADSPVAAYQVARSKGQFQISGKAYGTAPYGIAIPKGAGLDNAVLAALKKLMSDGTYTSILHKWGIEDGAITDPVINGATS
jgi:polar amino acid transport system substrate-binding protein